MKYDERIIGLLREQAALVRAQARAYEQATDYELTPALDALVVTEAAAVAILTAALGGEVTRRPANDPLDVLNISVAAADGVALRLMAGAVLAAARPYLLEAMQMDEEASSE